MFLHCNHSASAAAMLSVHGKLFHKPKIAARFCKPVNRALSTSDSDTRHNLRNRQLGRERHRTSLAADSAGALDVLNATTDSKSGQQNVRTVLAKLQLQLQPEDMAFVCDNFHVDHYGALVRPCPRMLGRLEGLGYTVSASFPSSIVSKILRSKYPKANIAVSVWKMQRDTEKLELFVVEGLSSCKFSVEARAINHLAFSPKFLDKQLVYRFKSIMQKNGLLQSSAGINPNELSLHAGDTIQGMTLIYFKRSTSHSGLAEGPLNLEICMAGMHSDLL